VTETGLESDTDTDTDTDTTDTDTDTPAGDDPFLSADIGNLTALFTLRWEVGADDWWVTGYTFQPGSWSWTGSLLQAATALDTCEVRDGDPEYQMNRENFGAVDLFSGNDHVWTISDVRGTYTGNQTLVDVDPRGQAWDFVFEGSYIPFFQLSQAITFPDGELVMSAPVNDAVVALGQPVEVRWEGAAADHVIVSMSAGQMRVRCIVADDGTFDVDPAVLGTLPAGPMSMVLRRQAAAGASAGAGNGWVQLYAEHVIYANLTLQ